MQITQPHRRLACPRSCALHCTGASSGPGFVSSAECNAAACVRRWEHSQPVRQQHSLRRRRGERSMPALLPLLLLLLAAGHSGPVSSQAPTCCHARSLPTQAAPALPLTSAGKEEAPHAAAAVAAKGSTELLPETLALLQLQQQAAAVLAAQRQATPRPQAANATMPVRHHSSRAALEVDQGSTANSSASSSRPNVTAAGGQPDSSASPATRSSSNGSRAAASSSSGQQPGATQEAQERYSRIDRAAEQLRAAGTSRPRSSRLPGSPAAETVAEEEDVAAALKNWAGVAAGAADSGAPAAGSARSTTSGSTAGSADGASAPRYGMGSCCRLAAAQAGRDPAEQQDAPCAGAIAQLLLQQPGSTSSYQQLPWPQGAPGATSAPASDDSSSQSPDPTLMPDLALWSNLIPVNISPPDDPADLAYLPLLHLASLIRYRKVTAQQLAAAYTARLKALNPKLLAVVVLTERLASDLAAAADAELAAGLYRGPLHGIPYGLKDLYAVPGYPTSWGAAGLRNQVCPGAGFTVSMGPLALLAAWV